MLPKSEGGVDHNGHHHHHRAGSHHHHCLLAFQEWDGKICVERSLISILFVIVLFLGKQLLQSKRNATRIISMVSKPFVFEVFVVK